jgi:hypothetical protein
MAARSHARGGLMAFNILDQWDVTREEMAEILETSPSARGLIFGYVAEYKLRKLWFSDERVSDVHRYDNHDRTKKGDIAFTYRGALVTVEVKSLQTATISKEGDVYTARFQCDASDRRQVQLPNGETLETTCLLVDEFDLLAVNLFALENKWRFAFARNEDLPRSAYRGYSVEQRQHLLATLVRVTWPLQPPFEAEPFRLLDEIVRGRSR